MATSKKAAKDSATETVNDMTNAVTEIEGVVDSAIALIETLADQIDALKEDPVALAALATRLREKKAKLATAVAANAPPTDE